MPLPWRNLFSRWFPSIFNNYLDGYYSSLYCTSLKKHILTLLTNRILGTYYHSKWVEEVISFIKGFWWSHNDHKFPFYRCILYNVLASSMTTISWVDGKKKYSYVGLSMETMCFVKFKIMAWQEGEDAGRLGTSLVRKTLTSFRYSNDT